MSSEEKIAHSHLPNSILRFIGEYVGNFRDELISEHTTITDFEFACGFIITNTIDCHSIIACYAHKIRNRILRDYVIKKCKLYNLIVKTQFIPCIFICKMGHMSYTEEQDCETCYYMQHYFIQQLSEFHRPAI